LEQLICSPEALAIHDSINQTARPYPSCSVKTLFEEWAERRGSGPCIVYRDDVVSYREVNELANCLAVRLRMLGARPGHTVGICVGRSAELIISLLAILKCGAAYLPFMATWPDELLISILRDAKCELIVSTEASSLGSRLAQFRFLEVNRRDLEAVRANPMVDVTGEAIAYVNFTSGTTGRSKGVQIQHRGIARLVTNPSYARLDEETVLLHLSPVTFDASTFEIWGALLNGGICVLYPAQTLRLSQLKKLIRRWGINCVFLTTALFNAIIDEEPSVLGKVGTILFGGEAYSDSHVRKALESYGTGRLVHVYGPTECTTFATHYPVNQMPYSAELPIGKPIQNTALYVVSDGTLCRPGEIGEILLGGPGVSPGYIQSGLVSQENFGEVAVGKMQLRLYRTGDYGYLLESGELIFKGRSDDQVKINGFRVELSLVSRAIEECPGICQCYVTVTDDATGQKMLLAFVVPRFGMCEAGQVREYLRSRIPDYMVPGLIHMCDALPLLATGKVNRRALLAMHHDYYRRSAGTE
jgi:D-alanine--poly(phosphoribitol) ligase subunit 1